MVDCQRSKCPLVEAPERVETHIPNPRVGFKRHGSGGQEEPEGERNESNQGWIGNDFEPGLASNRRTRSWCTRHQVYPAVESRHGYLISRRSICVGGLERTSASGAFSGAIAVRNSADQSPTLASKRGTRTWGTRLVLSSRYPE